MISSFWVSFHTLILTVASASGESTYPGRFELGRSSGDRQSGTLPWMTSKLITEADDIQAQMYELSKQPTPIDSLHISRRGNSRPRASNY